MILRKTLLACGIALAASQTQATGLWDLYQETLASDPRLAVSAAESQVGKAQSRQAFAQLLPSVSASIQYSDNFRRVLTNDTEDNYKGEKYVLSVSQPLFDMATWQNNKRYEYLAEGAELGYQDTKSRTAVDVLERYVTVLAAQDNLELIRAERDAIGQQREQLKSRYKRQLAVLTDLLEVEARYDGVKADEIDALNQVAITRAALAELVGRDVTEPLNSFDAVIDYQEGGQSLDHWINVAVANSALLLSLKAEVDAGQAEVRQSRASHYPVVGLNLTAQKTNIGTDNSPESDTETYSAGVSISVPIFNGGGDSARVDESHARLVIAQKRFEERRRAVLKSVREAYLNTEASWQRIAAADKAAKSAKKSHQAMEKGFEYGTVTVADVLDALREEYQFRRDFRQAQYDFAANRMALLQIAGVLSQDDIKEIDSWLSKNGGS